MNSTKTKLTIAVSTFLLSLLIFGVWQASERKLVRSEEPDAVAVKPVAQLNGAENGATYEKVICTCEVGSSPVEIAEVKDFQGNIIGVAAHVYGPEEAHLIVKGAKAKWDYLAVSAASAGENIKLIHQPESRSPGYDWTLVLKGKGIDLRQKVKNCAAVSDE